MKNKILITSLAFALALSFPAFALAQPSSSAATTNKIGMIKEKADAEIQRRIDSINDLITKIQGLKRLSDSDKTNLINMANSMIASLNSLKTKIDADTDLTTLRTDRQDIFTQYRIYMLFMPQLRIYVAADRIDDTVTLMQQVLTKLDRRATTSTEQNELTDAQNKLTDAQNQAQNAINAIKNLQPDQGNNGVASSNKQALLTAKGYIMTAISDLQTARHDFATVISQIKGVGSPNPSPSPTSTP